MCTFGKLSLTLRVLKGKKERKKEKNKRAYLKIIVENTFFLLRFVYRTIIIIYTFDTIDSAQTVVFLIWLPTAVDLIIANTHLIYTL